MIRNRQSDDGGFILPATFAAITLIALAALLTGRVVGTLLRASMQESFAVEEHAVTKTVTGIIDAWMADPQVSTLLVSDPADPRVADVWWKIKPCVWGEDATCWKIKPCVWGEDATCWKIDTTTKVTYIGKLRGGEAERHAQDVTATVAVGCWGSTPDQCQRTRTFTRRYERAVFAQYQLHYDTNAVPSTALDGPNGLPDDSAVCNDPNIAPDPLQCDDLDPATVIVFTAADTLNGPLRYSGNGPVLYCGDPTFKRIEANTDTPPESVPGCPSVPTPRWEPVAGVAPAWTVGLSDPERFTFRGDLSLPSLADPPQEGDERVCPLERVNHHKSHNTTAGNLRDNNMNDGNDTNDCPGEPGSPDHAILPGDIIFSDDELTIDQLVVEGSVTVYSEGDIIVCGDIEATGTNPAGGPNVIALITAGDVILDPSGLTPPACADDTLLELNTSHNLTLTNVAVLAPDGAVYARRWHLPHAATGGPTLTIEGSIAAKHLGLYGIPDQATGTITSGWAKTFTYPTDFWQARPPSWPGLDGSEWAPVGTPGSASDDTTLDALPPEPEPGITVTPATVTVTEGSTATESFRVELTTQPLANVTVRLDSLIFFTNRSTLSFTPTDWDTAQTVVVDASDYDDPDTIDTIYVVTLTATSADGSYNRLTEQMRVTVADDDIPDLVVSQNAVTVDENGTATFDVSLATQPTGSVTVSVTSADTAVATVNHAALTFTTTNWSTAQTITINGTDDTNADDDGTIVTVTAANGGYDGETATVAVTFTDDDEPPDPPGTPENVEVACTGQGATVSWNPSASGGQPDTYEVGVTFYGSGTDHTQTISHPTTEAEFPLGSGIYQAYVRASNSAGDSLNWGNGGGSC